MLRNFCKWAVLLVLFLIGIAGMLTLPWLWLLAVGPIHPLIVVLLIFTTAVVIGALVVWGVATLAERMFSQRLTR